MVNTEASAETGAETGVAVRFKVAELTRAIVMGSIYTLIPFLSRLRIVQYKMSLNKERISNTK
jgi:hypothetical protein